jgi:uncharacterized protein YbcI
MISTSKDKPMSKSNPNMAQEAQDRFADDGNPVDKSKLTMAQQIAQVASAFEQQRTGHAPTSVTVVLSDNTLVITLHGALSPAEKAMAMNPAGAAQMQEFHRQLFISSAATLRQEIKRITGLDVCEATAEIEPVTGTVVHAFTTGTVVQVFLLAGNVPANIWNGHGESKPGKSTEAQPC